ncbi:MAG: DMT family transporter [Desulfobacteraceae bacterium]|nr:MAG: DMT family transporter [Desulfobacteraceae bacterium]
MKGWENVTELQPAKKSQNLDLKAFILLTVLCASWGLQQVTIKIANQGISPVLQSGIRSVCAAILVWIWMAARREPMLDKDGTLWWGVAIGLLFAGEFVFIYIGLNYTNASRAVIFLYMSPFIVALGSQLFIPGEHLRKIQVAGLCCAFTGVLIAFGESLRFPTYRMLIGDIMLAIAAVLWGAVTVMIKAGPLVRIAHSKTLLYQLGVSAVVLPAASFFMGEEGVMRMTPLIVLCLIYQAVWVAFITYLVWFWLVRHYYVARIASFTFLTPIFGVLAGGILLDEPVSKSLLLSLILVGSGIYLVNRTNTIK